MKTLKHSVCHHSVLPEALYLEAGMALGGCDLYDDAPPVITEGGAPDPKGMFTRQIFPTQKIQRGTCIQNTHLRIC